MLAVSLAQSANINTKQQYINNRNHALQSLTQRLQTVSKQKAVTDTELKQKAATEADLRSQIDSLNTQLQSKREQQETIASRAINIVTGTRQVSASPACGDNFYANYIYSHESGCSLWNPNSETGACGLGQANPCDKLLAVCPNLDYTCENQFFTNYANGLGGWEQAYNIWISKSWW